MLTWRVFVEPVTFTTGEALKGKPETFRIHINLHKQCTAATLTVSNSITIQTINPETMNHARHVIM